MCGALVSLIPTHASGSPATPGIPVHRRVQVRLSGFKLFVGQFLLQTDLAVRFILFWAPDVGLVVRRVRENVIGLPALLNPGHFVRRKGLEFLLLRRSFWNDDSEARGNQRVFFALRARAARNQSEQCKNTKELIDRLFGELMEAKPGLAKDLMSLFFGEMTTRLMHHCYGNGID
jgi:hypothetical protein